MPSPYPPGGLAPPISDGVGYLAGKEVESAPSQSPPVTLYHGYTWGGALANARGALKRPNSVEPALKARQWLTLSARYPENRNYSALSYSAIALATKLGRLRDPFLSQVFWRERRPANFLPETFLRKLFVGSFCRKFWGEVSGGSK